MSDDAMSAVQITKRLVGQFNAIVVPLAFVRMLGGDYTAAALLTQLLCWRNPQVSTGKFYVRYEVIREALVITPSQLQNAREKLRAVGVTSGPSTDPYYDIDEEVLGKKLEML